MTSDRKIWHNRRFSWKHHETWAPALASWLEPRFRKDGMRRLKPGRVREICWDDSEWLEVLGKCLVDDLDFHTEDLADALDGAIQRVYHACRTEDAGRYFREGLRVHDRAAMEAEVKALVSSCRELRALAGCIDERIASIDKAIDIGRLYVAVDDAVLLDHAAQYLIFGSEWISDVLGHPHRNALKSLGVPTLLEIDLPLSMIGFEIRKDFSSRLLREWTRLQCNGTDWSAPIDFTFSLVTDVPADWIVGHSHPSVLYDPYERGSRDEEGRVYRPPSTVCAYCAQGTGN